MRTDSATPLTLQTRHDVRFQGPEPTSGALVVQGTYVDRALKNSSNMFWFCYQTTKLCVEESFSKATKEGSKECKLLARVAGLAPFV